MEWNNYKTATMTKKGICRRLQQALQPYKVKDNSKYLWSSQKTWSSRRIVKDIGCRIKESTSEKQATSYLMQAIGIAIQRGNSQCILGTVKDSRKMDEVYYL